MNRKTITSILLGLTLAGCEKPATTIVQTPDAPPRVEAQPFHGEGFRSFDGRTTLTLISRDECELRNGGQTLLCKYTKQADSLRVVVTAFGTNQVVYYRITPQGLQDNEGMVLLAPAPYAAAIDQARLARERQEQMRRDAEERKLAEQRAKEAALAERRTKYLEWIRSYFAKGQKRPGRYYVRGASDLFYPYTLTITEEPEITTERREYKCKFLGKMHWQNKMPKTVHNTAAKQDHAVLIESSINVPEDGDFITWFYFFWWDPEEKKYMGSGESAQCFGTTWSPEGQYPNFVFDKEPDAMPLTEERRKMLAEMPKRLIGTWRNESSLNTYFADGTTLVKNDNGNIVKEKWSIDGDILIRKTFEQNGRPDKGEWSDRIVEITQSRIVGRSLPGGAEWRAERVK